MVSIIFTAFGGEIGIAGDTETPLDLLAFGRVESVQVFVVVVGMVPDGPWGLAGGVDEELVMVLGVVLSKPTVGEGSAFVLHATPVGRWDAIADTCRIRLRSCSGSIGRRRLIRLRG